jgi:hypothetical protein
MGEIAPTYFASMETRGRIAETLPGAKIIFIFRNPVERAVSLYRLKCAYGMFRWSFDEALRKDPELINSGLYWSHLCGWQKCFPDEQLLVSFYDDLVSDPQAFVNRITDFIGLPPITVSQSQLQREYSSQPMTRPRSYLATRAATRFANWCKSRHLDHLVASVRVSPCRQFHPRLLLTLQGYSGPKLRRLNRNLAAIWNIGNLRQSIRRKKFLKRNSPPARSPKRNALHRSLTLRDEDEGLIRTI